MISKTSLKLKQYTEKAPENAWQNIAAALDNPKTEQTKYRYVYAYIVAAIAFVVVVGYYGYSNLRKAEKIDITKQSNNNTKQSTFTAVQGRDSEHKTSHENTTQNKSNTYTKFQTTVTKALKKQHIEPLQKTVVQNKESYNLLKIGEKNGKKLEEKEPTITSQELMVNENIREDITNNPTTSVLQNESNIQPKSELSIAENKLQNPTDKLEKTVEDIFKNNQDEKSNSTTKIAFALPKWNVRTYFSPTMFLSSSQERTLLPELETYNNQNKEAKHYGVAVAYNVKPRVYVRSGVEYLAFSQLSEKVSVTSTPEMAQQINSTTIDYSSNVKILPTKENMLRQSFTYSTQTETMIEIGTISQDVSYFAIPVEVGYVFYHGNRLDISINTGLASYILSKNNIYFTNINVTQQIGEARNLNKYSISSLIGFEMNYSLYNNLKLNIEPEFRYFFNTFTNGNEMKTQPISLGINLGLNYSF